MSAFDWARLTLTGFAAIVLLANGTSRTWRDVVQTGLLLAFAAAMVLA